MVHGLLSPAEFVLTRSQSLEHVAGEVGQEGANKGGGQSRGWTGWHWQENRMKYGTNELTRRPLETGATVQPIGRKERTNRPGRKCMEAIDALASELEKGRRARLLLRAEEEEGAKDGSRGG